MRSEPRGTLGTCYACQLINFDVLQNISLAGGVPLTDATFGLSEPPLYPESVGLAGMLRRSKYKFIV